MTSLDYRTPANVEYGLSGPNVRFNILFASILVAGFLAWVPESSSWRFSVGWALIGGWLGFSASYTFFLWNRLRGIPPMMRMSTVMMGTFFVPMFVGTIALLIKLYLL